MKNILDNKDIIYNLDYIVCIPKYDEELYDAFCYTFKNVILINDNVHDINRIVDFIKSNDIKKVILVDFILEYSNIIKSIDLDIEVKFILTKCLASSTDKEIYKVFENIFELYKRNAFTELGVLDLNWYNCLKNKSMPVKLLYLDLPKHNAVSTINKGNMIGLLNKHYQPRHSFYNELSAIKLNGKYIANIINKADEIDDFCKLFDIKNTYSQKSNIVEYIGENILNLCINFTEHNNLLFLMSMDASVLCILGNTDLLEEYSQLEALVTVKSDDDINEISNKIDFVLNNKDKIMEEYEVFRNEYTKKSQESIKQFLNINLKFDDELEKDEKLLSIIVPVYNTEKYISQCLDSIIKSKIDSMEILVINDGSTDNSEEVIKQYVEKYPDLINYIKQENHGLGNVRNVGLENAKGKYIFSVDSDDSIDVKFLAEAEKYLKDDIDLVICDWLSIPENAANFETAAIDYIFGNISKYKGLLYTTIMPSTCNKIIKKSLLKRLPFNYAEGLKYEDLSLNPLIMIDAEKIKYINKPYYEYKIRGNSIMRTSAGYNMIDVIKMLNDRIEYWYKDYCKVDLEEFKYYTYTWRIEEFIFNQIYDMDEEKIDEYVNYTLSKIENIMKEIYFSSIFNRCLDNLKPATKEYIINRNKALKENNLIEFLKNAKRNNEYIKITPPMFYYGEK